jgi:hypothetical protein
MIKERKQVVVIGRKEAREALNTKIQTQQASKYKEKVYGLL